MSIVLNGIILKLLLFRLDIFSCILKIWTLYILRISMFSYDDNVNYIISYNCTTESYCFHSLIVETFMPCQSRQPRKCVWETDTFAFMPAKYNLSVVLLVAVAFAKNNFKSQFELKCKQIQRWIFYRLIRSMFETAIGFKGSASTNALELKLFKATSKFVHG